MKYLLAVLLASTFAFTACDSLLVEEQNCKNCAGVPCTYEFKMIPISVVTASGQPALLSDISLSYSQSGESIDISQDEGFGGGQYIIATDAMLEEVACEGTEIIFSYSTDGNVYSEETFLIGKDCCHIQYLDEKERRIVVD